MFPFPISLKQAGSEQQGQVLGAHLIEISTLLHPKREDEKAAINEQRPDVAESESE